MVTFNNIESLASMVMPMEGEVLGENLIERLINLQVEYGNPLALIKSLASNNTFGSINSEKIYDAVMIYLNKTAVVGIKDTMQWKEFVDIKHWLDILISKTTNNKDKDEFLLLQQRLLKVEEIMKNPFIDNSIENN